MVVLVRSVLGNAYGVRVVWTETKVCPLAPPQSRLPPDVSTHKHLRFTYFAPSCAGRRPYTDGLGLEALGVKLDARKRIEVDDHFKTR